MEVFENEAIIFENQVTFLVFLVAVPQTKL
jgi:hypothetical protein